MEFNCPRFYSVLIIDDAIRAHPDEDGWRNFFATLVYGAGVGDLKVNIEVTTDPVAGLKLWQNEIFDLTLIGLNFTETRTGEDTEVSLEKLFLESHYQGVSILRLLNGKVSPGISRFAHRRGMCRFFLWAGSNESSDGVINRVFEQFSLEAKRDEYFVRKPSTWRLEVDNSSQEKIAGIIKAGVERVARNDFDWRQRVERLAFACRKNYGRFFNRLQGGCLLIDEDGWFPFLETLALIDGRRPRPIKVLPGRIPNAVLDGEENKLLCFPIFSRKGLQSRAVDFIHRLRDDRQADPGLEIKPLRRRNGFLYRRPCYSAAPGELGWPAADGEVSKVLGYCFKNHYFAAATPLTGISVVGERNAIESLAEKVVALLQGPAGAVLPKTAYLAFPGQWDGVNWPALQVQSHMRSRCLKPSPEPVLWNSGRTALEMLPPAGLNNLLKRLVDVVKPNGSHRVIVSLGSKFFPGERASANTYWLENYRRDQENIWRCLFEDVFSGLEPEAFPLVEINVRHFLREIVKKHLGGDEYLNPVNLFQEVGMQTDHYWRDFKIWLECLHNIAVEHRKKLILKLPYRSDTLAYINTVCSLRTLHRKTAGAGEREYGVRGLTLLNALKVPVPMGELHSIEKHERKFSRAWYAHPWAWQDAADKLYKYQMSGALLAPYRNQILAGLMNRAALNKLRENGLEIMISGGITDADVCRYFNEWKTDSQEREVISALQVGTYGLLHTRLSGSWGIAK